MEEAQVIEEHKQGWLTLSGARRRIPYKGIFKLRPEPWVKDEGGKIVPGGDWGKGQQLRDNMAPLGPMKLATMSGSWRKSGGKEGREAESRGLESQVVCFVIYKAVGGH